MVTPSRLRSRLRRAAALAAAVGFVWAPQAAARQGSDRCMDLAYLFYVLAEYELRGESRESQRGWVLDEFGASHQRVEADLLERALDFVYASDASPVQIRRQVLSHCSVDEQGRVVIELPGL